jgi:hypothetical protein
VRAALAGVSIEVRMDSAFFSDEIVGSLDAAGVKYTMSVPFERFTISSGVVEIEQKRIVVRFDKRGYNPILREACLDQPSQSHGCKIFRWSSSTRELHGWQKMLIDFLSWKSGINGCRRGKN